MGWSIGGPDQHGRFVGYGVPCYCDHPQCDEKIDRGLAYVCGGEPFGGDSGCGLYFCGQHLSGGTVVQRCSRCRHHKPPFAPKQEHPQWVAHLIGDKSWAQWRRENPEQVAALMGAA